jgi:hypothetical protein
MTSKDWILCAEHAGDYNWRMTRKIASKNVPEGFNFIYRDAKLIQVQYCQACRDNGEGYKGRGMSYREKDEIEEHFVEIYDPYERSCHWLDWLVRQHAKRFTLRLTPEH